MQAAPPLDLEALRQAAAAGDPAAMTRLAALKANGILVRRDWDEARALLGEAAAAGETSARAQIRLLGGDEDDWRKAAEAIDPSAWRDGPPAGVLSDIKGVRAVVGLLSPQVCAHVRAVAAPHLARQTVQSGSTHALDRARTNSGVFLSAANTDAVIAMVRERIAAALGLSVSRCEPSSVLHYRPGEQFAEHYDALPAGQPGAAQEMARIGQRALTVLVYLNDDFEGGATEFPRLNLSHRGKTGDALAWVNVNGSRDVEPRSLHAGRAPTRGEKWAFSQWIRDRDCSGYWG